MTDKLDAFLDALERRLRAQEPPNQKLTPALMAAIVSNARRDADEPDDQWLGPEPVPPGRIIDDLREDNRRLRELVIKHRARLEIDHVFDINGNRVEADLPESQDGILCRDATIGLLEREIERLTRADPTPESGWSEWLDWDGSEECPLPGIIELQTESGDARLAGSMTWLHVRRFCYREDAPGGWVARPKGWVPPESLWAEGSPVRCEWTRGLRDSDYPGEWRTSEWDHDKQPVTHIRLLPSAPASEPAPEMPEGFEVAEDGALRSEVGTMISRYEIDRYGPTKIRAAVEAWLKEMERR